MQYWKHYLMNQLISLYEDLYLPNTVLLITNEITGAGYIATGKDDVLVRWGSYKEGIRVLEAYITADSTYDE